MSNIKELNKILVKSTDNTNDYDTTRENRQVAVEHPLLG